ncbi:glycosyltransferase family 2 protein [Metapseudomonas otitidis]|uniref:glycosyltransferase family 2 protein n=1 Tax=Metapseudomonas otitidis TaxID=319939 RepID=UPI0039FBC503
MSIVLSDGRAPLISVILPVYNAAKYLRTAIQSILDQTLSDFELIVINDGSTDSSGSIIKEFAELDPRVRVVERENRGLVYSLNQGLELSRGTWIARMDADDVSMPERFQLQVERLIETRSDVCGTWIRLFGASANHVVKYAQSHEAVSMELLFTCPFAHPSVMMRADLVKALKYDADWETCEDYELWRRVILSGGRATNLPKAMLMYRQHDVQISSLSSVRQHKLAQRLRAEYSVSLANSLGLDSSILEELIKIREPSTESVDMDKVDLAVNSLFSKATTETGAVITGHALRLYFRMAGQCSDISARWRNLNHCESVSFLAVLKLWLLSRFKVRSDSLVFSFAKKLYFRLFG